MRREPSIIDHRSSASLISEGYSHLVQHGVESAGVDARLLLQHALGVSREMLLADRVREINRRQIERYRQFIARRAAHEPVAKIIGTKAFWKHEFVTSADTLDPRPDSETLIEAVLAVLPDHAHPLSILDLGTGTGCLLLTLLAEYPLAHGLGIDISDAALGVARLNAQRLELTSRASFIQGDWMEGIHEKFDLIISNPPYIPRADVALLMPDVSRFEPYSALAGGDDGLDAYRVIIPRAAKRLTAGGVLVMEVGQGQDAAVVKMGAKAGFKFRETRADLAGISRAVVLKKN